MLEQREAEYRAASAAARERANTQAAALTRQSPAQLGKFVRTALDDALVAHYPFDATMPIPDHDLPSLLRPKRMPPAELVSLNWYRDQDEARDEYERTKKTRKSELAVPENYTRRLKVYTPNRVPGGLPAVLQAPVLKDGVKGKALFFDETNKGFLMGVPQDAAAWGAGFLPSHHQGVLLRSGSDPVLYLKDPEGLNAADRDQLL